MVRILRSPTGTAQLTSVELIWEDTRSRSFYTVLKPAASAYLDDRFRILDLPALNLQRGVEYIALCFHAVYKVPTTPVSIE